jgi:hypothetical protein
MGQKQYTAGKSIELPTMEFFIGYDFNRLTNRVRHYAVGNSQDVKQHKTRMPDNGKNTPFLA